MQGMWWEFSKAFEASTAWQVWPGQGQAIRRELLRAQRFFLPIGVDLSVGKRYDDVADLLRLPFDTVAVMSATESTEEWGTGKRERLQTITIAVSAEKEGAPAFEYLPADKWPPGQIPWLVLLPLARAPVLGQWVPGGPAALVTKRDSGDGLALDIVVADSPFTRELLRAGASAEELAREVMDDLKVVVELCLLLGLQNVRSVCRPAPKGAAKSRQQKGKTPLFDYHVLEVDGERWEHEEGTSGRGKGSRSHLRRGHIRRISESRRVWVRACYVHGSSAGFAAKDYALSA